VAKPRPALEVRARKNASEVVSGPERQPPALRRQRLNASRRAPPRRLARLKRHGFERGLDVSEVLAEAVTKFVDSLGDGVQS